MYLALHFWLVNYDWIIKRWCSICHDRLINRNSILAKKGGNGNRKIEVHNDPSTSKHSRSFFRNILNLSWTNIARNEAHLVKMFEFKAWGSRNGFTCRDLFYCNQAAINYSIFDHLVAKGLHCGYMALSSRWSTPFGESLGNTLW